MELNVILFFRTSNQPIAIIQSMALVNMTNMFNWDLFWTHIRTHKKNLCFHFEKNSFQNSILFWIIILLQYDVNKFETKSIERKKPAKSDLFSFKERKKENWESKSFFVPYKSAKRSSVLNRLKQNDKLLYFQCDEFRIRAIWCLPWDLAIIWCNKYINIVKFVIHTRPKIVACRV